MKPIREVRTLEITSWMNLEMLDELIHDVWITRRSTGAMKKQNVKRVKMPSDIKIPRRMRVVCWCLLDEGEWRSGMRESAKTNQRVSTELEKGRDVKMRTGIERL